MTRVTQDGRFVGPSMEALPTCALKARAPMYPSATEGLNADLSDATLGPLEMSHYKT